MKCVRVSTGEVVAAFAFPAGLMSFGKMGKVGWVGDRHVLGDAGEVMVVISLLGILEAKRRSD